MEAKAVARYLRISPRKMRIVIDTIREKPVDKALTQLTFLPKRGARLAKRVLESAIANAKVLKMNTDHLVVAKVFADGGPTFKRFQARSMGRADQILKRTTHLTVVVREDERKKARADVFNSDAVATAKPRKKIFSGPLGGAKKKTGKVAKAAKA